MKTLHRLERPGCGCGENEAGDGLLSLDEALARIAGTSGAVEEVEIVPLQRARGRVLAEPVVSSTLSPPFDNAAMDGYALSAGALEGDGPWVLPVGGCIAAGHAPSDVVRRGTAVQVLTGAPLPKGTDTVVMQEHVLREGGRIVLRHRPDVGAHIRPAGEDMMPGQVIMEAGTRLGPREIAAAAAAGAGSLRVRRKLRVVILATGDELCPAGDPLAGAHVWDVNSPMLAAAISGEDVEVLLARHEGDALGPLKARLAGLAETADIIVTTGGVSVGSADLVRPAMAALGGETVFAGVAIKPGKPVVFGRLGKAFWLGLPGNPLAAFTTWMLFGNRLLECLAGVSVPRAVRRHVVAGTRLRHKPGRCELRLARLAGFDGLGREVILCPDVTNSARVSLLPAADGLVLIPAEVESISEGELLEFVQFCAK
ncbi:gephyrin-like molybdotransferase Glp [Stappia sp.]|uniref:molybdopterin molybdotransferase MoeA n=1 Tax=Stappia sp. TaxID=1870903 RepID=UPI003A99F265